MPLPRQNTNIPSPSNPIAADEKQTAKTAHMPPWVIIILLLIFPTIPFALYFMYREKRYHKWFAYVLWVQAGWQILFYGIQAIFVLPQLQLLYENTNIPNAPTNISTRLVIPIILILIEIGVGIVLIKKVNADFLAYKKLLIFTLGVLIAGYVLGIILSIYSFVLPIYNLTNSIK